MSTNGVRTVKEVAVTSIQACLMFLFIFNVSFQVAPPVTTGRLALVVAATLVLLTHRAVRMDMVVRNLPVMLMFVGVVVYAGCLYWVGGGEDSTPVSRGAHFLAYSVFGSLIFTALVGYDLRRFLSIFTIATLAQAVMVAVSFVSDEYRVWLSGIVVEGGNISLADSLRVPGFSNSSGALLSLIQGLGVFSALFAAKLATRRGAAVTYTVSAYVILLSTVPIGRTGLLLGLAFIAVFLVSGQRHRFASVIAGFAALLLTVTVVGGWVERGDSAQRVERIVHWALEPLREGLAANTIQVLQSQSVPIMGEEALVGTGLVSVVNGVNASGSDSGYVQTWYSLGVPMAALFYMGILMLCIRYLWRSEERWALGWLVCLMFVVEIKEPMMFKYVYPFVALSLLYLTNRDYRNGRLEPMKGSGTRLLQVDR